MTDLRNKLPCSIDVLGTLYRVELRNYDDDASFAEDDSNAYCYCDARLIVVGNLQTLPAAINTKCHKEEINAACLVGECAALRHEIIHAYLNESGLRWDAHTSNKPWAKNEEMIDWFAVQAPKIFKTYSELGVLE